MSHSYSAVKGTVLRYSGIIILCIRTMLYLCFNLFSIKLNEIENASYALQFNPKGAATR